MSETIDDVEDIWDEAYLPPQPALEEIVATFETRRRENLKAFVDAMTRVATEFVLARVGLQVAYRRADAALVADMEMQRRDIESAARH